MAKPFDVAVKDLVEGYPADWVARLTGEVAAPVTVMDADLSTVSPEADKLLRVGADPPWLLHLEFQASRDPTLARRLLRYNVLIHERHRLPTLSALLLLRPQADDPTLMGRYGYEAPGGSVAFEYRLLKVWETSPEEWLTGGLGTLPLAPVSAVTEEEVPEVIERMEARLLREAEAEVQQALWMSTFLLMGLRFGVEEVGELLRGVNAMQESTTYQAILEEGRRKGELEGRRKGKLEGELEGRRKGELEGRREGEKQTLLLLGRTKFGPPSVAVRAYIESLDSQDRLNALVERLLLATSWDELIA